MPVLAAAARRDRVEFLVWQLHQVALGQSFQVRAEKERHSRMHWERIV